MLKEGLFITVEGPDGAGKSTQIEFIRKYMDEMNRDVVFTREPGGTVISEKIRSIILDKNHTEMNYIAEALLYAASRAQLVNEVIKPALEQGKTVICDRFVDSSIAYQGFGRNLGDCVETINHIAVGGCMPDLTLLIMVDSEKGIRRVTDTVGNRAMDRIEQEKIEFHRAVHEGYESLYRRFPNRIVKIDGGRPIEEVSERIKTVLDDFFKRYGDIEVI